MPHNTSTSWQGAAWPAVGQAMLEKSLQRAVVAAQLALGEQMYAAGIDDGELGAQLAALDEKIRQAKVATIPTRTLKVEREILVVQLAAAALAEEAPLPGADAEYERAKAALAALAMHNTIMMAAKAQAQRDKVGRRRAIIGYGLFSCLCLVSLALIFSWLWG